MKKVLSSCLAFCLLLSLLCIDVYAVKDQSTGVEYTVRGYKSTLYLQGADLRETGFHGELNNAIWATAPNDVFNYWGDVTDSEFVEKRSEYRQSLYDWAQKVPASQTVARWNLVDGYERTLTDSDYLILKYFNIPANLKGTKSIQREGVPFLFTGDGNGNIKVSVEKGIEGHHEAKFYIPEERNYDMTDRLISESYSFSFIARNSKTPTSPNGIHDFYTAGSMQEGLQHCKQQADLTEPVYVNVTKEWKISLNGSISYAMVLNVEYGTTSASSGTKKEDSVSVLQSGTMRAENSVTQESSLGEMGAPSAENTSLAEGNTLPEVDSTVSSVTALENDDESILPINQTKNSTVVKTIIICSVVLITAVAGILLYFLKFKKIRNTPKKHKK